jgi:hypothetical protein
MSQLLHHEIPQKDEDIICQRRRATFDHCSSHENLLSASVNDEMKESYLKCDHTDASQGFSTELLSDSTSDLVPAVDLGEG